MIIASVAEAEEPPPLGGFHPKTKVSRYKIRLEKRMRENL